MRYVAPSFIWRHDEHFLRLGGCMGRGHGWSCLRELLPYIAALSWLWQATCHAEQMVRRRCCDYLGRFLRLPPNDGILTLTVPNVMLDEQRAVCRTTGGGPEVVRINDSERLASHLAVVPPSAHNACGVLRFFSTRRCPIWVSKAFVSGSIL